MKNHIAILLSVACLLFLPRTLNAESFEADVIIYGGTSAAMSAAVQVSNSGRSVIVVSPDKHLGGLTSGGLGWLEMKKKPKKKSKKK